MENFPQTYEPTGSQSILEQFVGLKNFMNNKLNSNEYVKTIEQTLTEKQKAQARKNIGAGASTINVIDNLSSQSNIDALSANQGRVLNEKIDSSVQTLNQTISQNVNELQQDIDVNGGDIASLQGDVSELNQEIAKTLKTPMSAPISTELVGIDNTNSQVNIEIGDLLKLTNNVLNAKQSIKLLWENLDPNSNFPAQQITFNSNDYDFLLWGVNGYLNNNVVTYLIKKGKSLRAMYVDNNGYYNQPGDSIIRIYRDINYVNDSTYQANTPNARNWLAQNNSADRTGFSDAVIPLYVLGVKL